MFVDSSYHETMEDTKRQRKTVFVIPAFEFNSPPLHKEATKKESQEDIDRIASKEWSELPKDKRFGLQGKAIHNQTSPYPTDFLFARRKTPQNIIFF